MIRRTTAALSLAVLLATVLSPGLAQGGEYAMSTAVRYVVDPSAGAISVSVEVTFTNTTPNPPGQVSGFTRVDLAVHGGASDVTATDGKGALAVELVTSSGVQVASVKLRARLPYNKSVTFTLSYRLADGVAPNVYARPDVIKFSAWGLGTSSEVTVELPSGYQARADGDPMAASLEGSLTRLTSGPIADPSRWLALVTASRPAAHVTIAASVPLTSGTVDLQVRAWASDPTWGERTLALLTAALPRLEREVGLPYTRVGPLVVSEAVGGEGADPSSASPDGQIVVAFDAPAFTVLHQAAHIWVNGQLASDRWIREGLASHYAAWLAVELGIATPYDPALRASQLAADGRPLVQWQAGALGGISEAFGQAASWAFMDQIAGAVGEDHLREVLRRTEAGVTAYDPVQGSAPTESPSGLLVPPLDSRRLLDQLATVSGIDLAVSFREVVLGQAGVLELSGRALARADYERLLSAAGGWGPPGPVRVAMAAWRFDEARAAMTAASTWLVRRDLLLHQMDIAGLAPPGDLQDRYLAGGGGAASQAELGAEQTVVEVYLRVQRRIARPLDPLQVVGLIGSSDPRQLLAMAATALETHALVDAAHAVDTAQVVLDRAPASGAARIASGLVLLLVAFFLVSRTIRRRDASHYTGVP